MVPLVFGAPRRPRRISLTPMIDVVFLLLIFFMLTARFGSESAIAVAGGEGATAWRGAPRLVEVAPGGISLNGRPVAAEALGAAVGALAPAPDAAVVVRGRDGATLGDLVAALDALRAAGFGNLVLAE